MSLWLHRRTEHSVYFIEKRGQGTLVPGKHDTVRLSSAAACRSRNACFARAHHFVAESALFELTLPFRQVAVFAGRARAL